MTGRVVVAAMVAFTAGLVGCGGDGNPTTATRSSASASFAQLEARPLHLPRLATGAKCPFAGAIGLPGIPGEAALGPFNGIPGSGELGPFNDRKRKARQLARLKRGPVFVEAPHSVPRIWYFAIPRLTGIRGPWRARQTLWISRPTYDGPVLVRGRQLDGPHRVGFGDGPRPRWELRLPAGDWTAPRARWKVGRIQNLGAPDAHPGWRVQSVETRVRTSGCYAYQVDGYGFSYRLAFATIVQRINGAVVR